MKPLNLNLDIDDFLASYWQKKPLLITEAFADFDNPVPADELAGLACETNVESRIILEKDGATPWEVRHGPFDETDFTTLPESHWTLLVQDVEKHLPDLLPLLNVFNFIPAWRLDHLMISYATDQGSVGPHLDAYDVFLIQAQGQRHWKISNQYNEQSPILKNTDLKILREFTHEQEWTLEPGDILYLPPGVAHHGVALGECITFSVGFRAPSYADLVQSYTDNMMQTLDLTQHYTDLKRLRQKNPHELDNNDIQSMTELALEQFRKNRTHAEHWLGSLLTESKENFTPLAPENILSKQTFLQQWKKQDYLYRDTRLHFLFTRSDTVLNFYVDSVCFTCRTISTIDPEAVCSNSHIKFEPDMDMHLVDLLFQFYQHGYFYLEESI